jgi:phage tail-like protein
MRAANTDFMQGFRYHVIASDSNGTDPLQGVEDGADGRGAGDVQAGFQSVTIPELSVEASEYREGTFEWTQKYPGPPTVSEITLMRGITKRDSSFFKMIMASIRGTEYRSDVSIYHYQRSEMSLATSADPGTDTREIKCGECFAIRAKPAGDFDSMTGDVSLAEVDLAIEYFDILYGSESVSESI